MKKASSYSRALVFMYLHRRGSEVKMLVIISGFWDDGIFKFSLCFSVYLFFPAVGITVLLLFKKTKKLSSLHLRGIYQQTIMILVLPGLVLS